MSKNRLDKTDYDMIYRIASRIASEYKKHKHYMELEQWCTVAAIKIYKTIKDKRELK